MKWVNKKWQNRQKSPKRKKMNNKKKPLMKAVQAHYPVFDFFCPLEYLGQRSFKNYVSMEIIALERSVLKIIVNSRLN